MSDDDISVGELARMLKDAIGRLEKLAQRLDSGQFVRTDLFERYENYTTSKVQAIETSLSQKASSDEITALRERLEKVEDDKTWVIRLVIAFIILAVLGAIFVTTG